MNSKLTFPGLKKVLLRRPDTGSPDISARGLRALFQPADTAVSERRRSLVEFLGQVPLFQDLGRRDLGRLARIVHERDYQDGEYICEEGKPGTALFILRRGVVEVVRRGSGAHEVALVMLEPPASFEESAAIGTEAIRRFSFRARGPVSVLALGRSDLDALIVNFPVLANKVLMRLAGIMAIRLQMLLDVQNLGEPAEHQEGHP
jgi:CRP/FNR family cyclic AMP-dependent transcriptional regulator